MTAKSASSSHPAAALAEILLSGAWYFLAAVLALTVCLTVAYPFVGVPGGGNGELGIPVSFTLNDALPVTSATLGIDKAEIRQVSGTLVFRAQERAPLIALGLLVVALAVVLFVTRELRAVLRSVRHGQPFDPANAARIRRIAWILLLGEPARALVIYVSHAFAMKNFTSPGLRFATRVDFNFGVIMCGLIILALAEVFRAGTRLDEDQSLTI